MVRLIALTGKAHSGKNTLGNALAKALGFATYAFAFPIKTTINALFDWDQRHSEGALKEVVDEKWGFSPRFAYQRFGTDFGRDMLRQDIWLKYAEYFLAKNKGIVVTDLRFENEAEWVRRSGGLVVHVHRAGAFGIESNHASERGVSVRGEDYRTSIHFDVPGLLTEVPRILSIVQHGRENV